MSWSILVHDVVAPDSYKLFGETKVVSSAIDERMELPEKKWKFSVSDIEERGYWDEYMKAYEDTLSQTSTAQAPWYIIPAEHRWMASAAVAEVVVSTLKSLKLRYPTMSKEQRGEMMKAKEQLESE